MAGRTYKRKRKATCKRDEGAEERNKEKQKEKMKARR